MRLMRNMSTRRGRVEKRRNLTKKLGHPVSDSTAPILAPKSRLVAREVVLWGCAHASIETRQAKPTGRSPQHADLRALSDIGNGSSYGVKMCSNRKSPAATESLNRRFQRRFSSTSAICLRPKPSAFEGPSLKRL